MKTVQILIVVLMFLIVLTLAVGADAETVKTTHKLRLGASEMSVNVYENAAGAAAVTFFAPHFNEQIGSNLVKSFIGREGGRLVEIESTDERGRPQRMIKFLYNGKVLTIDPNRIYTENGRNCNVPAEAREAVEAFGKELLKLILGADGRRLRANERFIVAVHNNTDVSAKNAAAQVSDLTAVAFIKAQSTKNIAHGIFEAQADGVFLSNAETDEDNFIYLSTPLYMGYFAEKGFNVVVQKPASRLESKQCAVDDGSFSVFSAQAGVPYICLEADGVSGYARQSQMLEAVYGLFEPARMRLETVNEAAARK